MNTSTPTAVADLHVGDVILSKPDRSARITRLVPLVRTNRTRVYVRSVYVQKSMRSDWRYGTFTGAHLVNKVTS